MDQTPDKPADAGPPKRQPWVPPAILAAMAFGVGLFGNVISATDKVKAWFVPPPLPAISQEYLMVDLENAFDLKAQLQGVADQVQGLRFMVPGWLTDVEPTVAQALGIFCKAHTTTDTETCEAEAQVRLLLGSYALKSFDPKLVSNLKVDLALLTNPDGAVDAFDGFISGNLSVEKKCFLGGVADECMADWQSSEQLTDLPALGPGETLLIPLFLSVQIFWKPADGSPDDIGEPLYDGYAPTPFRFPAKVFVGDRVLIEVPRPMQETPSLRKGFYEGRG